MASVFKMRLLMLVGIFGLFLAFHPGGALLYSFTRWRLDKKGLQSTQQGKSNIDDAYTGHKDVARSQRRPSAGYINLSAAVPPGFISTRSGGCVFSEGV